MNPRGCRDCPVDCLFRQHLAASALARLLREAVVQRLEAGFPLIQEGEPAFAIRCLRRGYVKVIRRGRRGEDVLLRVLGPGSAIGLRAVITEEVHAAGAQTLGRAEICMLPANAAREAIEDSPELMAALARHFARELRTATDERLRRTEHSVARRTAFTLLQLPPDAAHDVFALRRTELAQWIGAAPETLSRTLHGMERRGWITLERGSIIVRDRERLARCAYGRSPD